MRNWLSSAPPEGASAQSPKYGDLTKACLNSENENAESDFEDSSLLIDKETEFRQKYAEQVYCFVFQFAALFCNKMQILQNLRKNTL